MQILLLGLFLTLGTDRCLAVLNAAQSSNSFSGSKDKAAAAAGYQYNESATQQNQPSANKQQGYHYQPTSTQQQQQEQQPTASGGYQYQATAQQYPTPTATQSADTQSGYHYQSASTQQQHQQQPAFSGSSFYQHSGVGPAVALNVDNTLPTKLPVQANHYFVQNLQPVYPTQTAGYNYFAPRPNKFATLQQQPQREAASSILDNSNNALLNSNTNDPSERQNFLLQKLAQLNLLSGTRMGAFNAGQGHTNNLISSSQESQQVSNAQFAPTNSQQASPVADSFRQPSQGYNFARPAPTTSPAYHTTSNREQGAYFGEAAASTALSNFEHNMQQASFGELSKQSSPQTTQLDNNEKYPQLAFVGNSALAQSDRSYSQQSQQQALLVGQGNGYKYAPQIAQPNNGLNVAMQTSLQPQDYFYSTGNRASASFLTGSQHVLPQHEAGQKTLSYYQVSPSSQQQALWSSSSGLLSEEQFPREQQQTQQQQEQSEYQQQHHSQYQQHSQSAVPELASLVVPSTTYVYQKMQSNSYELPTIVQQGHQHQENHRTLRRPHVLYGLPSAEEREATPVSASASAYTPARNQYQASYF